MTVAFWNYAKRKKEGAKVNSKILSRLLKKAQISTPLREILRLPGNVVKDRPREAYKEYRKMCQASEEFRKSWLESLAGARAEEKERVSRKRFKERPSRSNRASKGREKATEGIIRGLISRERTRKIFGRIRKSVGKETLTALSTSLFRKELTKTALLGGKMFPITRIWSKP